MVGVDVDNLEISEETEREGGVDEMVDDEALSRGGNGEGCNGGFVSIDWQKGSLLHGAKGDTTGLNGVEVGEGTDEWPEIIRRGEEGAREIKSGYLGDNWGEDCHDSGGGSAYSVIEFDALEVGEGQACISGCFKNGGRDVSGVIAYDSLLIVRQNAGCVLGELVEGVDLLRGMESDGLEPVVAGGRDPAPGGESTGIESLGIIAKVVDDLVNELVWNVAGHWW